MAAHDCQIMFCRCKTTVQAIKHDFKQMIPGVFNSTELKEIYRLIYEHAKGGEHGDHKERGG